MTLPNGELLQLCERYLREIEALTPPAQLEDHASYIIARALKERLSAPRMTEGERHLVRCAKIQLDTFDSGLLNPTCRDLLAIIDRLTAAPTREEIAMKIVNPWVLQTMETCRAQSDWSHYLDIADAILALFNKGERK